MKSYPTLIFFPSLKTGDNKSYRYTGPRTIESIENFVFEEEYLLVSDSYNENPRIIGNKELVRKYWKMFTREMRREINYIFFKFNVDKTISEDSKHLFITILVIIPIAIVLFLVFCWGEDSIIDTELSWE